MIRLLKTLIFLVFSFVLFSSCKKDNSPTQGQMMAARLKADLNNVPILTVYIYDYSSGNARNTGTSVDVNADGTITVVNGGGGGQIFNLESLVTYSISGTTLFLYF